MENLSDALIEKIKKVKVFAFDIDGILTDGRVWWDGSEVGWNRCFNVKDGFMMRELMKHGYKVGVVTGGDSLGIEKRFRENLKLDFICKGKEDKLYALDEIAALGFAPEQILFMGDDLFDIPLLKRCGVSATAADGCDEVRNIVDIVSKKAGGKGCAREVMDLVRRIHELPLPYA
jgi:3-deoxy-D-manno-octulosonate 8-phosphate phosphatase (KDO 8-P phosphatase)